MSPHFRIGFPVLFAIVPLVVAFALPAYAAGCPPGTVKIGESREETATEFIIHPICKELLVNPALAQSVCSAKLKIAADQEAIRLMNFKADTESFDRFEAIAQEQKEDLTNKLLSTVLDHGIEVAGKLANEVKSLNLDNVHSKIEKLKFIKLNKNQRVIDAMYEIAQSIDKRKRAKAYSRFIKELKTAKTIYSTGTGMAKDEENASLRFLLGALKIAQRNPEFGLLVTTVDVGENLAYLAYLPGQIDDLSKLTDDRMEILNERIKQMKQDMNTFKTAKKNWQASGMSGEPNCGGIIWDRP